MCSFLSVTLQVYLCCVHPLNLLRCQKHSLFPTIIISASPIPGQLLIGQRTWEGERTPDYDILGLLNLNRVTPAKPSWSRWNSTGCSWHPWVTAHVALSQQRASPRQTKVTSFSLVLSLQRYIASCSCALRHWGCNPMHSLLGKRSNKFSSAETESCSSGATLRRAR